MKKISFIFTLFFLPHIGFPEVIPLASQEYVTDVIATQRIEISKEISKESKSIIPRPNVSPITFFMAENGKFGSLDKTDIGAEDWKGMYDELGEPVISLYCGVSVNSFEGLDQEYLQHENLSLRYVESETCTEVGSNVFISCSLEECKLPNVKHIGEFAFQFCSTLKHIDISSVTNIEKAAFDQCGLEKIALPNIQRIGEFAFFGTASLKEIDFSNRELQTIPQLDNENAFFNWGESYEGPRYPLTNCVFIIPDTLYDKWVAAPRWNNLLKMNVPFVRASERRYVREGEIKTIIDNITDKQEITNIVRDVSGGTITNITKEIVESVPQDVTNMVSQIVDDVSESITNRVDEYAEISVQKYMKEQVGIDIYNAVVEDTASNIVTEINKIATNYLASMDTSYDRTYGISRENQSIQIISEEDIDSERGGVLILTPEGNNRVKDWIVYVKPSLDGITLFPPTNILCWCSFGDDCPYWISSADNDAHVIQCPSNAPMGIFFTNVSSNIYTIDIQEYTVKTNNIFWTQE